MICENNSCNEKATHFFNYVSGKRDVFCTLHGREHIVEAVEDYGWDFTKVPNDFGYEFDVVEKEPVLGEEMSTGIRRVSWTR